jgi:DNA replication protein DnaC
MRGDALSPTRTQGVRALYRSTAGPTRASLLAQLDGVCEQAAKGDVDYKGFLTQALEAEWRGRHQRGVESRLKLARLPWLKSLEQFDFDFQPSVDRKMLRELAGLSFVERTENVVLLGPPESAT